MKKINILANRVEHANFFKNAFTIYGSVTPIVIKNVFIVVFYAAVISYLHYFFPNIYLPVGPFEYAGLILGLILVFRVNSGYDRWWEGRKIWGNIVNQTRNLTLIILNYTNDKQWQRKMTDYITSLPYLIKNLLQEDASLNEIKHLVTSDEYSKLVKTNHKPNFITSLIAHELNKMLQDGKLNSFAFMQAEEKRAMIVDNYGALERIINTPIPFAMAVKCRRFILMFLLTLPFALVEVSIFSNPLICGLVAYALLSLDQIGFELQNPFSEKRLSHLPLQKICNNIENNIKELTEPRP